MENIFKNKRGVTLVELVIVLAVVSIIVSATVGIFTSFITQQSRIVSEQELLNQTSYALEYISRSVRDAVEDTSGNCVFAISSSGGYYYALSHFDSASATYQGIKVLSKDNVCHEFFLDNDGILKEIKDRGAAQPILFGKFDIQYVRFIINGDKAITSISSSSLTQPRVSVSISVKMNSGREERERIIQTTISQDKLNVNNL